MKKWLSVIAAAVLVLGTMAGCGGNGGGGTSSKGSGGTGEITNVSFPLETPVEFTFLVEGIEAIDFKEDLANNKFWSDLEAETNVHVNFQFLGDPGSEKLALLISSGEYGDALWGGPIINSAEASKYIASEKFADLTDYITPELMPNLSKMIENRPDMKKMLSAADGRIYTLPRVTELDGWYLESPIVVNKRWLDNLGLSIPTTLDQFTDMLRAFAKNDPNGNGRFDEVPFLASTANDYMNMEALLGLWGLPTKDATNDSYVMLENGQVKFVPTDPAYKEYLKYMALLYKEKLLWGDCFTGNATTVNTLITSDTCTVGCFTNRAPAATDYRDDYVTILPPKVDGYEPRWFYNPAINGSKNQFFTMDVCEQPAVLMAWVDQLYTLESAMRVDYGEPEDGRYTVNDDGIYTLNYLDTVTSSKLDKEHPTLSTLLTSALRAFTAEGYEKINLPWDQQIMQKNYELYKDVVNKEIWPRPYISAADAFEADTYTTDIFYQVSSYRANCITGTQDIDSTWDNYVNTINSLGLESYLEILQRSYDAAWK